MRKLTRSLKGVLALAMSGVFVLASAGLFAVFEVQSQTAAVDAAQIRQSTSLRILVDQFSAAHDGISTQFDTNGEVSTVRWDALAEITSHDLIDRVGQISGETATLFGWVPEEGDFIRLTTNIIKPDGSRAVGTWLGKQNPVHAAMLRTETFRGEAVILGKPYFTIYEPILDASGQVIGIFYVGVDRTLIDAQVAQRMQNGLWVTGVMVLLTVLAMVFVLGRALRPLNDIAARVSRMADGALDDDVPHTQRLDELGQTAKAVEVLRGNLVTARMDEDENAHLRETQLRVVSALQRAMAHLSQKNLNIQLDEADFPEGYVRLRNDFAGGVHGLSTAIGTASTMAENVRNAATQIGSTSDDLALRVERQAATLVESASALDGLTQSSKDIARAVENADSLAIKSRDLSDESGDVVRSAIEAISRIERASEQINQIITAIDDIAFQTNLLALNAGVEAARAGSAGKGFAVVAQEVRTLAQTAAESAQKIKGLILTSNEEVSKGSELVQKTGDSLEEFREQVAQLGTLIGEISTAVRGQTDGLSEINDGVQNLQNATQHNAAVVEELNAAGQSLNQEASELSQTLDGFDLMHAPEQPANWEVTPSHGPAAVPEAEAKRA